MIKSQLLIKYKDDTGRHFNLQTNLCIKTYKTIHIYFIRYKLIDGKYGYLIIKVKGKTFWAFYKLKG